MPHVWMHDMRRSFASLVVNTGATPYERQAVLGATSPWPR